MRVKGFAIPHPASCILHPASCISHPVPDILPHFLNKTKIFS
jgi:hypothetical protein